MSRLARYDGDVRAFASQSQGQERTTFGTETITDDINQQINQFFLRGWGVVGSADQPSIQDFNALGFTTTQLLSYLFQRGVAEWNGRQKYYIGSMVTHNGKLWTAQVDKPTDEPDISSTEWNVALTGLDVKVTADAGSIAKRNNEGTFEVSVPTEDAHPSRKKELDAHVEAVNAHIAVQIVYDNAISGLTAEKVQSAIDETVSRLANVENAVYTDVAASTTWNQDTDTYTGTPFATDAHRAMRRCLVLPDGTVNYYLNEFDSTLKENGIDRAVTDGTDGQVMVEIPQCYVRTTIRGSQITWELSAVPLPGFILHPVFEEGAVEKVYIGAYQAVVRQAVVWQGSSATVINGLNLDNNTSRVNLSNDRLYSTPGNFAMVGLTRGEFRQLARNGGYQLYDYWQWQLVQMLWITEYGNWNSQAVLGNGNTQKGSWPANSNNQVNSLNEINGLSDRFGNYSGSVASPDGVPFVTYRGIENPWGNSWQFIDGVNVNNRQMYVSTNEVTFADNIDSGDYSALGDTLPIANNTFIKNWQSLENVLIPKSVGGGASGSTFIGDALWTNPAWRTMAVGGNASYAVSSGLSSCYVVNDASFRSREHTARLSKKLRI